MNPVDFLANVSLFSLMKRQDLEQLAKRTQVHTFEVGDVIIREGERDTRLFVIISGEVLVVKNLGTKKERRLSVFGPKSYFGEMSLIDDLVRSASVVAKEEAEVISLDQLDLLKTIEKYPAIARELLQMLSRRVRAVEVTMMTTLGGFLPICASCKKIKDEDGSWTKIEEYIADHSDAEFSHSLCPECMKILYPEYVKKR